MAFEEDIRELDRVNRELKEIYKRLTSIYKDIGNLNKTYDQPEQKELKNKIRKESIQIRNSLNLFVSNIQKSIGNISNQLSSSMSEIPNESLEKIKDSVIKLQSNLSSLPIYFNSINRALGDSVFSIKRFYEDTISFSDLASEIIKQNQLRVRSAVGGFGGIGGGGGQETEGGTGDGGSQSFVSRLASASLTGLIISRSLMNDFTKYKATQQSLFQTIFRFLFSSSLTAKPRETDFKDFARIVFGDVDSWRKIDPLTIFQSFELAVNEFRRAILNFNNLNNYQRRLLLKEASVSNFPSFLKSSRAIDNIKKIEDFYDDFTKRLEGEEVLDVNLLKRFNVSLKNFTDNISYESSFLPSIFSGIEQNIRESIGFLGDKEVPLKLSDIVYEVLNRNLFGGKAGIKPNASLVLFNRIEEIVDKFSSGLDLNDEEVRNEIGNLRKSLLLMNKSTYRFTTLLNEVAGRFLASFLNIDIVKFTKNFTDFSNLSLSKIVESFKKGEIRTFNPFIRVNIVGEKTGEYFKSLLKKRTLPSALGLGALKGLTSFLGLERGITEIASLKAKLLELDDLGSSIFSKTMAVISSVFSAGSKTLLDVIKKVANAIKYPLSIALKQVQALSVAISGLAVVAGLAFGSVYFGLIRPLVESAKVSEQRFVRLESALQSTTQAVYEYQRAIQFASRTPFLISQVSDASAMLRAFQFDPFEKVGESGRMLIEILGDMAGAMGTDLETATWALIRAQVGEWEIMQNNFQISARMIPQLKGLASGTKEYGQAIVEFLDKQQRFMGGLFKMSQSIQGMQSNIRDFLGVILEYAIGIVDANSMLRGTTFVDEYKEFLRGTYFRVTARDVVENIKNIELMSQSASYGIRKLADQFDKEFNRMGDDVINLYNLSEQLKESISFKDVRNEIKPFISEMEKLNEIEKERFFFASVIPTLWSKLKAPEQPQIAPDSFRLAMAQTLLFGNELTKTLGRILGIVLSIIMKLFYPVQRLFEFIIEKIKMLTLSILNFFAPLEKMLQVPARLGRDFNKSFNEVALSVVQGMGKSFSITADQFSRFRDRLLEFNRDYAFSLRDLSKQGSDRILASMTLLERWIMVLAIVGEFAKLYIEDLFKEIWKNTEQFRKVIGEIYSIIGSFVFDVFKDISVGFFEGLTAVFDPSIFLKFLESIRNLVKAIDDAFREVLGLGKEGSVLRNLSQMIGGTLMFLVQGFVQLITLFLDGLTWVVKTFLPIALEGIKGLVNFIKPIILGIGDLFASLGIGISKDKWEKLKKEHFGIEPLPEKESDIMKMNLATGVTPLLGLSFIMTGGFKKFFEGIIEELRKFIYGSFIIRIESFIKAFKGKLINLKNLFSDPKLLGKKTFDILLNAGKFLISSIFKAIGKIATLLLYPFIKLGKILLSPIRYLIRLLTTSPEQRRLERLKRKYEKMCPFADPNMLNSICSEQLSRKRKIFGGKGLEIPEYSKQSSTKERRILSKLGSGLGTVFSPGMMFLSDILDMVSASEDLDQDKKGINKSKSEKTLSGILKDTLPSLGFLFSILETLVEFLGPIFKKGILFLLRRFGQKTILKTGLKLLASGAGFLSGIFLGPVGWIIDILMILDLIDDIFGLGIKDKIAEWWDQLKDYFDRLDLKSEAMQIKSWLSSMWGSFVKGIKDKIYGFTSWFVNLFSGNSDVKTNKKVNKLKLDVQGNKESILSSFIDWVKNSIGKISKGIKDLFGITDDRGLLDIITEGFNSFVESIGDVLRSIFIKLQVYLKSLIPMGAIILGKVFKALGSTFSSIGSDIESFGTAGTITEFNKIVNELKKNKIITEKGEKKTFFDILRSGLDIDKLKIAPSSGDESDIKNQLKYYREYLKALENIIRKNNLINQLDSDALDLINNSVSRNSFNLLKDSNFKPVAYTSSPNQTQVLNNINLLNRNTTPSIVNINVSVNSGTNEPERLGSIIATEIKRQFNDYISESLSKSKLNSIYNFHTPAVSRSI
ncbi:MAG: hypothetical protein KatS3mg068_1499 [Candidatus Sericytochromatia bacterium]|nr:MAG: hypothetical protein KatS3mg068_1499 [Candidatus Sericytochromatia bacterium]